MYGIPVHHKIITFYGKNKPHDSLTILTMNEILHQWSGNILKQLSLSGINTKYFFKTVLCLMDTQRQHMLQVKGNKELTIWAIIIVLDYY